MAKAVAKLNPADFVHLHNHTQYSLLDGLTKVPALVNRVKELGMESVAITDHGLLSGAIELYKTAKEAGIKPIIGMEAYMAARLFTDKDPMHDRQSYHLILLAMNQAGYKNLMRLSSIASLEGFYYRPRIDRHLLEKYSDGLIVLSGCAQSELSDALRQDQPEMAEEIAAWYKKVFGDRYYLELQDHGHAEHPSSWDEQEKINSGLLKLSDKLKIPAVVTGDAHYLMKSDQEAHEVLLCVQTAAFLDDENRMSLKDFELHVTDPAEVIKRWRNHPELIINTRKIAERCNLEIELGKILIPKFPVGQGKTEKSSLNESVWQGLAWRYGQVSRAQSKQLSVSAAKSNLPKDVIERAEYELGVVDRMGFNGYFLIVSDFINWGKDKGIVFGPGRGSAASSIMAYALRITEIDPLKYDLLFERFLNPDRISMPDMDIDIQDSRRDEVINYCIEKYGHNKVANIVTFGRMAARNSVRDVARVLRMPYADADRLAKMIPPPIQGRHTLLEQHLKDVPELKAEYANNREARRVFDLAMKLEGTIRSHGVHAAGVVIAPDEIVNFSPLEMAQKGVTATQYSMGPIMDDIGLLKMDFLGLSNLTTIKNALRIVKKVYGKDIRIEDIPLDDQKTYQLLQKGETTGVFQLESAGMKRYLKKLKPTVFEDIVAMVALYRPGPMQFIDDFIARKHGQRKITYLHPKMEPALKNTYGVMVYQEQFMQISKDMCGFSGGQADTLRKAAGKKNRDTMAKMKKEFVAGMVKHSQTTDKIAEKIWAQIETFADYGFNKVHSACYGLIAYQTAYLKANYPEAFMAALMTSDYDNTDRLAIEITECKQQGIDVLPPDVSESFHEFGLVPKTRQIRFGLDAIKNVGHNSAEEILRARESLGGKFHSLEDFCREVDNHIVNRKSLESLIKAGALDSLGDRSVLLNNIDTILAFAGRLQKESSSGQVGLFGAAASDEDKMALRLNLNEEIAKHNLAEQLSWERELLGLYLSHHPLENYQQALQQSAKPIKDLAEDMDGSRVTIGGAIIGMREIVARNGAKMAFARLADLDKEIEVIVFPKLFKDTESLWQRDQVVLVEGRLNCRDRRTSAPLDDWKILAESVRLLSQKSQSSTLGSNGPPPIIEAASQSKERLYIRIEDSSDHSMLTMLKEKLDVHNGETEVVIVTGESSNKQIIKLPQSVSVNEESLRSISEIFGPTNVVIR